MCVCVRAHAHTCVHRQTQRDIYIKETYWGLLHEEKSSFNHCTMALTPRLDLAQF